MSYIEKVQRKIKILDIDKVIPFSDVKIDGISIDTTRKILHRLHDNGFITIVKRGFFKREEPFSELLFVYGSLKKVLIIMNFYLNMQKDLVKHIQLKSLVCLKTALVIIHI